MTSFSSVDYPDLYSSQSQMPRYQHKNKINSSLGDISSLQPSYSTAAGPEYSSIAEVQEKRSYNQIHEDDRGP